jgi:16S rRNA (adenine1518-N6/adenine1519-N6)-dimethyltransferase
MNRIIGLMKKYNVSPIKSLGQNFLIDENIIEKLARAISPKPGDYIIEIGPGLGSLTERLVGKSAVLYCIEIDKRLHQIILERFGSFPGFYAGNFDVLKFNFEDPLPGYEQGYKIKVTGNLPYYITTPIIMKFLSDIFDLLHGAFPCQDYAGRTGFMKGVNSVQVVYRRLGTGVNFQVRKV